MLNNLQKILEADCQIKNEDFQKITAIAKEKSISLLAACEEMNLSSEEKILQAFAKYYKVPVIPKLSEQKFEEKTLKLIPKEIVSQYLVIPLKQEQQGTITLATSDPHNLEAFDTIRFKCQAIAKPILALPSQIREVINKEYSRLSMTDGDTGISHRTQTKARTTIGTGTDRDDGPIIKMVNDILFQCSTRKASDIHIEPYEDYLRVRLRIDGNLIEIGRPSTDLKGALISRVKIMANLDIAETRIPQDGAININIGTKPVDFRVSTLPTAYGEKIVMRILDKSNLQVDMTQLGFEIEQLKNFKEAIANPHGMILVTGPTGSGKTTTLYSALQELNEESVNIITAEDPVEYNLQGINQVQMKPDIGLTFASALRSFLRQDPDIIMVGEIRDLETAEIAVKAALTGHLVLSTLHTNSATDTISRLLNMGVAPFNLVASLVCVTAQRLVRKICEKCRVIDDSITPEIFVQLGIPEAYSTKIKAYKGAGCSHCGKTGAKGRIAVHEVLVMNEAVKRSILNGAAAVDIKKIAMQTGMKTLRQSALTKMAQGICAVEEVVKTTSSDKE